MCASRVVVDLSWDGVFLGNGRDVVQCLKVYLHSVSGCLLRCVFATLPDWNPDLARMQMYGSAHAVGC